MASRSLSSCIMGAFSSATLIFLACLSIVQATSRDYAAESAFHVAGGRSFSSAFMPGLLVEDGHALYEEETTSAAGPVQTLLNLLSSLGVFKPGMQGGDGSQSSSPLTEWPLNLPVEGAGGPSDIGHYAGYYRLNHTHDAKLFYFFFESRGDPAKDPVVLWMTGGPGCSSELAVFYENGPFMIADNLSLVWNDYGWDKVANIIYIDQPVNTGFSHSGDPRDDIHTEKGVSKDVYVFLQEFFHAHPEFSGHDFFVTGESYGGHYVPAVASYIHAINKEGENDVINLKGFAIGNGFTQPSVQFTAYPDFLLQHGLISQDVYESYQDHLPLCEFAAHACGSKGVISCYAAYYICNSLVGTLLEAAGNINVYDIRLNCTFQPLCYDFSKLDKYLAQPQVRKALGVGDVKFVECSDRVYRMFIRDSMRNLETGIPGMLNDGIRALIYAGEYDFICNWIGNARWVEEMNWSGQFDYTGAPWLPFKLGGKEKGLSRSTGPLNFLKVNDAGHMVPMDQPESSLEMIRRWLRSEPLGEEPIADPVSNA